jgi:hypothetical protein
MAISETTVAGPGGGFLGYCGRWVSSGTHAKPHKPDYDKLVAKLYR